MKQLKATELKNKSVAELQDLLKQEQAALYKARRDLVFRQITDVSTLKARRHNIARILTIMTQKQGEQA